jgi:uncharacterized protein (TIGR04255 family)
LETEFDLLGLPDVPRIMLDHPPLALAICQLQFSSVFGVADPKIVAPFQRAIQDKYPVSNQFQDVGIPQSGTGAELKQLRIGYQFASRDDIWRIVLTQDSLAIEARMYADFDSFLERIREAVHALVEHIQPTFGTRLGLRYINEIRTENLPWSNVIRRELLGPIAVPEFIENTTQFASIQQLLLRYPNEQGITMHHGFVPGGTTVRPRQDQELQNKEFYLLDFDAFKEFPISRGLLMDVDTICQLISIYHQMIYRLFRWSVTDQFLTTFGR